MRGGAIFFIKEKRRPGSDVGRPLSEKKKGKLGAPDGRLLYPDWQKGGGGEKGKGGKLLALGAMLLQTRKKPRRAQKGKKKEGISILLHERERGVKRGRQPRSLTPRSQGE